MNRIPMRVAVITPYYKEEDTVLKQCHDSILGQTFKCDQIFVSDGFPKSIIDSWNVAHVILPFCNADVGNTPRVLGSICAFSSGYDAVAFLDADNWYNPEHIERMVTLHHRTGAVVCTSNRTMHRSDGSYMFKDDKNDGVSHVDSNCYFLTRAAMPVLVKWATMPKQLSPISDTIYLRTIKGCRLKHSHDTCASVCYRTTWESDFQRASETPPPSAKTTEYVMGAIYWYNQLSMADKVRLRKQLGFSFNVIETLKNRLLKAMLRARHSHTS